MAKNNALSALDGLRQAKGIEKVNDLEAKKFVTEGASGEAQSIADSEDREEYHTEDTPEDKAENTNTTRASSTIKRLKAKKKANMYHTTSINFEDEVYVKLNKLTKTTGL